MNLLPPSLAYLKIRGESEKGFGFWIPIFILWPLFFILLLLVIIITFIVDFILLITGRRYHHFTLFIIESVRTLSNLKGTSINVEEKEESKVKINIL